VLFKPKKYGRRGTFVLAVSFYVASLGFGMTTIACSLYHFDDFFDKVRSVFGFFVGTIVWAALGKSYSKMASDLSADHSKHRPR
jgi:hypothetical protein